MKKLKPESSDKQSIENKNQKRPGPLTFSKENGLAYGFSSENWIEQIKETTGCKYGFAAFNVVRKMLMSNQDANDLEKNCMLGQLYDLKPRDSVEAMMCAQMVINQDQIAKCFARANRSGLPHQVAQDYLRQANRLMATFSKQVEGLHKYRNKGKQTVTVQHVTVNEGGQAVVGDVRRGGGNEKN